ncbi:MAG: radical SAM protein, partial [Patescibacteria group bacterium]|nr:radical SAM protein [Patescibacteria group bacterium]
PGRIIFFVHKDRVEEICQGFIDRKFKVTWEGFCRFDYFSRYDDKFLKLIEKSGCRMISFGGESGNQRVLDEVIDKGVRLEQIKEATRKMAKTNMAQVVSFMCGVPTETESDLKDTMNLIDELLKINPRIEPNGLFFYTPYPGTKLFDLVVDKYHFVPPKSLEQWQDYKIYRDVKCTWLPENQAKTLQRLSVMTRFPFYTDNPKIPERFQSFPYNLVYNFFSFVSRFRWKHRFFYGLWEWVALEKIMEKTRGFV